MKKLFILIIIFSTLSCKNKEQENNTTAITPIEQLDPNRETIVNIFNTLNVDERAKLMRMIITSHDTPDYIIDEYSKEYNLSHYNRDMITSALIVSPNISKETLEHLYLFIRSHDNYLRTFATHPNLTEHILIELSTYDYDYVRAGVADNNNTPVSLLNQLTYDSSPLVRGRLAGNENSPINILQQLATDNDPYVRYMVAGNKNTPSNILEQLSLDTESIDDDNSLNISVRSHIASNPSTPIYILQSLSEITDTEYEEDIEVRSSVAYNPSTPTDILDKLSYDKAEHVRASLGYNKSTPLEILNRLATDKSDEVRTATASNQNISQKLLQKLSEDHYYYTRIEVARNIKTPSTILNRLAKDKDQSVVDLVKQNPNTSIETKQSILNKKEQILQLLPLVDPKIYSELLVGFREF